MCNSNRNILIVVPSSVGFVFPALRIAKELLQLRYTPIICTGSNFASIVSAEGLMFYEHALSKHCFDIQTWHIDTVISEQFELIKSAIKAHRPIILAISQMCVAYTFIRNSNIFLPVIVIGSITALWPRAPLPSDGQVLTDRERAEARRYDDWKKVVQRAARLIDNNSPDYERRELFYGDALLIRSTPFFDPLPINHYHEIHQIGDLLYEASKEGEAWQKYCSGLARKIIYVQHGRHFNKSSLWSHIDSVFHNDPREVIADLERYDGERPKLQKIIHYRSRVPLITIVDSVDAIVCSGGATAILIGLLYRKPLLVGMVGSGGEVPARLLEKHGVGFSFDPSISPSEHQIDDIKNFVQNGPFKKTSVKIAQSFLDICLGETLDKIIRLLH
jgi:UDP:flavonoid glycosyltransferase YjiC (YdhE family)